MGRATKKPHEILLDGLQTDLKCLIIRFIGTESVRYEEFSKIWRGLNFSLIFDGIKTDSLLQTFTLEAFALAASSLVHPNDLQTRICSMYILYALYYTQPCIPKVKIRMDPKHWQALMNLSKELKDQGHLDAAYIFFKMHSDKIFQFTSSLRHANYSRHKTDDGEYERWRAGKELMTTTFNPDLLEQLHGMHNHYQQMKQDMGFQDNLSMKLVRESMADYIIQRIHVHQPSDDDEDDSEQEREVNPASERASRIASIKKKSFSNKGQGSSSQRHLQEAATTSASEQDEKPSLSPNRPGRRGRRKMKKVPGRKPVEKDRPATEMEKKKAWSILPMRRLIEEEEEDGDEDSDVEQGRKKKKAASKSTKKKGAKGKKNSQKKQEKGKKKKKKSKKKKKKRMESETDKSTADTSCDDLGGLAGSATCTSGTEDTGSSPRKQQGQKRKRASSTSEAEISDGKRRRRRRKKGNNSSSDGQKDRETGWSGSDGNEMSSKKGKSPQKAKSPKGSPARVSFCESDGESLPAETSRLARGYEEANEMQMFPLRQRRRGRPKKSVMPEEDVTAWGRSVSDDGGCHDDHHVGVGWVSDDGASTAGIEQVNTGVRVDVRLETTEPPNRLPPKKVLLGLKKPRSQKDQIREEQEQAEEGGKGSEQKGVENTPQEMRKEEGTEGQRDRSTRKSSRTRKVVKY